MGTIIIRTTEAEHKAIEEAATAEYQSINQWCRKWLNKGIADFQHNSEILSGVQIRPELLKKAGLTSKTTITFIPLHGDPYQAQVDVNENGEFYHKGERYIYLPEFNWIDGKGLIYRESVPQPVDALPELDPKYDPKLKNIYKAQKKGLKSVVANLQPGETVIIQERDKRGRFEKRGKK